IQGLDDALSAKTSQPTTSQSSIPNPKSANSSTPELSTPQRVNPNVPNKPTLTQTEADNLFLERQNRYQNLSYPDRKKAQYWMSLDKQFHGTVNVEFDYHDSFFVTITKADGSTQKVMGSEFYKWLYGSGFRELKLSEKEIDAMGKEIQKFIRFMESDLRKF
ncbi:MAG: hypothetical protein II726_00220, partial [Elusimicrobiaceae bacterium]|nr:hypothetical protein [Elusimicrobiaceae bacterium]